MYVNICKYVYICTFVLTGKHMLEWDPEAHHLQPYWLEIFEGSCLRTSIVSQFEVLMGIGSYRILSPLKGPSTTHPHSPGLFKSSKSYLRVCV